MKKFVSLLLVVMVLGAAFACTAWAEELEGEEFANPTYGYKVDDPAIVEIVKAPTCKEPGVGKLANGQEIRIEPTGEHDFVVFTEEGNPCEEGYKVTYKCSVCGELKEVDNLVPVAHDWQKDEEKSEDPSCSEVGKTYYKCSTCGKYKGKDGAAVEEAEAEAEEVAMVPHTFEGNEEHYVYTSTASRPTCTKAGTAFDVCTKCGKLSDPITVPALGHNQYLNKEGKIDEALLAKNYTKGEAKGDHGDVTCSSHSFDTYYCNRCASEPDKDKKITVEEGGKVVIYANEFPDNKEELLPHTWIEKEDGKDGWTETKAATCAAEGEATRTCEKCGTVETRSIPKLAHTPVVDKDGKPVPTIVTAPTCEKEGEYTFVCSVCGEKFVTEEEILIEIDDIPMKVTNGKLPALGHKWETNEKYLPEYPENKDSAHVWKVTKPATCTEEGEMQKTCERCGIVETDKREALGHDWNDWVEVVKPNTKNNNKGLWTRTCKREGCKEVESYEGKESLGNKYTFPTVTITKTYNSTDEYNNQTVKYYNFRIVAKTAPFKDYTITVTKDGAERKDSDKWNPSFDLNKFKNEGYGWVYLSIPADEYGTYEIKVTVTDEKDQTAEASITEVNAAPAVKNGLVAEDGTIRAYKDGKIDTSVNGLREFNGGSFVMKNGQLDKSAEGLTKVGEDWYYCSYGQVHTDISQLVPYNGGWFFVTNGKLDRTKEGLVEYDGGKFIVSAGQVHYEKTGLWQDPATGTWAYYDHGQFWPSYSGEAEYDGVTFQVKDGLLVA